MSKFINVEDLEKHKMKSGLAPGGGVAAGWNACIKYIQREVPAADVRENVRGKWVNGNCNQCGEHAPFWAMASTYYQSNFCPNCGAIMRGENDEKKADRPDSDQAGN